MAGAGRGRLGGRRSHGLHKSLFPTLQIFSLETAIKRVIPVNSARRTDSLALSVPWYFSWTLHLILLPFLKAEPLDFTQRAVMQRCLNLKNIYFKCITKKKIHTHLKNKAKQKNHGASNIQL